MSQTAQEDFRRYERLVAAAMPPVGAFVPEAEGPSAVQVERGAVYPAALRDPSDPTLTARFDRLAVLSSGPLGTVVVVDRSGHHRPVYRPLLVYACLQAFRLAYETLPRAEFGRWEEGLRPWCDLLEAELTNIDLPGGGQPVPAARGAAAAEAAWTALALWVAGKVYVRDAWTDLPGDTFGRLTRSQAPSGSFLTAGASDNPEAHWFHELALLHAAASYAVQAEDRTVAAAVGRATAYHLRETQPDHATQQPWGLFAFAWNADTRPLADGLLHAAGVQAAQRQAEAGDGVASILLADALYCLRLFG
jgi:hypothetical protein